LSTHYIAENKHFQGKYKWLVCVKPQSNRSLWTEGVGGLPEGVFCKHWVRSGHYGLR